LGPLIVRRESATTPFNVEYARSSQSRGGAPTLIPINRIGGKVMAEILVLGDGVPEREAKNMLWRRELHQEGSGRHYVLPAKVGMNTVLVDSLGQFGGIEAVLYTRIRRNIPRISASKLARLAIGSVKKSPRGQDGMMYLKMSKASGIRTPLSDLYEESILAHTGALNLDEALLRLRGGQP